MAWLLWPDPSSKHPSQISAAYGGTFVSFSWTCRVGVEEQQQGHLTRGGDRTVVGAYDVINFHANAEAHVDGDKLSII